MRRARVFLAAGLAAIAVAAALPAIGSAYQINFGNYLGIDDVPGGSSGQGHKLKATKCQGGLLGNWTLQATHFILIQDASSDIFVQMDLRVNLPITQKFKKLSVTKLEIDHNDNYPDSAANELHDSLVGYFNKASAKVNGKVTKLTLKDKGLEIAGSQVLDPSTTTAPFKPKPGC